MYYFQVGVSLKCIQLFIINLFLQTKLPIRGSIEVPSNAIETEEIVNLFLNLSENNVVLTIVRIFLFKLSNIILIINIY